MRILTNSPFSLKGLISIAEATEDAPQKIIFCIPIDNHAALELNTLSDFRRFFRKGITTKIKESGITKTINLDFRSNPRFIIARQVSLPYFTAAIKDHRVHFSLSRVNFLNYNTENKLNFEFYYNGKMFDELFNKKLVILEPNWTQLDSLFLEERILFSDLK